MAWRRIGDKPLFEPMLTQFTDVCIYVTLRGDELIIINPLMLDDASHIYIYTSMDWVNIGSSNGFYLLLCIKSLNQYWLFSKLDPNRDHKANSISLVANFGTTDLGGHLKNAPVNKIHIFQCMGMIFSVKFQRVHRLIQKFPNGTTVCYCSICKNIAVNI